MLVLEDQFSYKFLAINIVWDNWGLGVKKVDNHNLIDL